MTALLQGSEDAHQDRLGFGPVLAAVGVTILPRDHGWSDLALAVVVVERDFGMVQEREQFGGMTPEALHQPARVALLPRLCQQFVQPHVQSPPSRCERRRGQLLPPCAFTVKLAVFVVWVPRAPVHSPVTSHWSVLRRSPVGHPLAQDLTAVGGGKPSAAFDLQTSRS